MVVGWLELGGTFTSSELGLTLATLCYVRGRLTLEPPIYVERGIVNSNQPTNQTEHDVVLLPMIGRLAVLRLAPPSTHRNSMRFTLDRASSLSVTTALLCCGRPVLSFAPPQHSRGYHSTTTSTSLKAVLQDEALKHAIQEAWGTSETDGILKLASEIEFEQYEAEDLVFSTLEAVPTKGQAAGILNAWIGSCSTSIQDLELGAERAWQLLHIYDSLEDMEPDMVTLALVHNAMTHVDLTSNYHTLGNVALERAQHLAKKQGGSKRRKSLATSSRKQIGETRPELLECHGITILHESDQELIVNKPSGMTVFHKHTTTSGKVSASRRKHQREGSAKEDLDISLEAALLDAGIPLSTLNVDGRGLVHRIDRGTSGCMVLAKTDVRHAQLVSDFFLRKVKKDYQAVVELPEKDIPDSGTLDSPVHGRPALSMYTVEERFDDSKARLRVQTKTGRKHQVRVHCAEGLSAPIVGDAKYALLDNTTTTTTDDNDHKNKQQKARFCLHASGLHVPGIAEVEAPVPTWWQDEI